MFNLIITIISIGLIAALALASIYYGGDAFSQGSAKAAASTVVSQAQQVSAANTLYKADNAGATNATVATLSGGGYLASVPVLPKEIKGDSGADLDIVNNRVEGTLAGNAAEAVCREINIQLGLDDVPADESGLDTMQYGCFGDTEAGSFTFIYK